jgi:hypothetical protein
MVSGVPTGYWLFDTPARRILRIPRRAQSALGAGRADKDDDELSQE